jgi:hypothetical protein
MIKLRRVEPGLYQSLDYRVLIKRNISQQTRRADEVCWAVAIDGKWLHTEYPTKREAVEVAERRLSKEAE